MNPRSGEKGFDPPAAGQREQPELAVRGGRTDPIDRLARPQAAEPVTLLSDKPAVD
jgi:hypothetical protein